MQDESMNEAITAAADTAPSDAACKRLLASKVILAKILHGAVPEYKDCTEEEVYRCIEGEPAIGEIPVGQDLTGKYHADKIKGNANEDTTSYEGTVLYDIQFDALLPHTSSRAHMIINLEAQGEFTPGDKRGGSYHLVTRGLYYCARMISAQKGREFTGSDYQNIVKVYSIWICLDPPKEWQGAVNTYDVTEHTIYGAQHEDANHYDKLCVMLLCLGENSAVQQSDVVGLLNALLSKNLSESEKKRQLTEEYGIEFTGDFERRFSEMCDYGSYLLKGEKEKNLAEGRAQGRAEGRAEGAESSLLMSIRNLMKNASLSADKAMDLLGVASADRAKYKALLSN